MRPLNPKLYPLYDSTRLLKWEDADLAKQRVFADVSEHVRGVRRAGRESPIWYSIHYLNRQPRETGRFDNRVNAARWYDVLTLVLWKYRQRGVLSGPTDAFFNFSMAQAKQDNETPAVQAVIMKALGDFHSIGWLVEPARQTKRVSANRNLPLIDERLTRIENILDLMGQHIYAIHKHITK